MFTLDLRSALLRKLCEFGARGMLWLACVATAQAPTLSDRVDALEAIVKQQQENFSRNIAALESTVHEQRTTISSLQRALASAAPSSTDAWPATAPRRPQFANCEGSGANVKAFICCAMQCA